MKTTTKIIFGAALSVFSLATLSIQAFAAEITNLTSTGKIQMMADGVVNPRLTSVDPNIHSVLIDFALNQKVQNGDHIEFSTHALPVFGDQDIFSDATKTLKIGELKRIKTVSGSRAAQNISNTISSADFSNLKPEDQVQYVYKIIFNESAQDLRDIRFSLAFQNKVASYSIANKEYQSRAWIKVADQEVSGVDFTVAARGKFTPFSGSWFDRGWVDMNTNKMYVSLGYGVKENHQDGNVEFSFKNTPYFKFSKQTGNALGVEHSSNFMYTDKSRINQYGLILPDNIGKWSESLVSQNEQSLVYNTTSHKSDYFASGFGPLEIELTEEGRKYVAENGKLPQFEVSAKYTRKDGSVIIDQPKIAGEIKLIGNSANFFSKIIEEAQEEPKLKEKLPEPQPEPKSEQIQAPNTGFETGAPTLALSAFSLLGLVTLFARKK